MRLLNRFLPVATALLFSALPAFAQTLTVANVKPSGVYTVGEKIVWHLSVTGEGASSIEKVHYVLKKGELTEVGKGDLTLTNGSADLETKLDSPGHLFVQFTVPVAGKAPLKNEGGALVSPEEIKPSAPPPDDFDAFWKDKIKELGKVAPRPALESAESGNPNVDYWKITLDNIRDTKIHGQLARPKNGAKLPALLIVQWAGVYPLHRDWATNQARGGWLTLNIEAHDLPFDAPDDFYKQQSSGPLNNYPAIGNENRDTSYFLRMYLSCYQALEYLTHRDDWDGKTLVVMGASQGGLQSLMIAGLHPKITALIANVPAGCDQTGPQVGRQPGWPMWPYQTSGRDAVKVRETSRYYDVVNFARHIHCPALVACGLIDTTCPPSGVAAAFNQIKAPKELLVMPRSDHQGRDNSQAPYYVRSNEWLKALAKGGPPPTARE